MRFLELPYVKVALLYLSGHLFSKCFTSMSSSFSGSSSDISVIILFVDYKRAVALSVIIVK